jgi:HAD superfamily hydrolase (TIGR01450 family)
MLLNKKCFVFDIDGTVSIGDKFIDGALELLSFLKQNGKSIYFVTNNSSKSVKDYLKKFEGMGLEISKRQIITSGTATIAYLNKYCNNDSVYLLGTNSYKEEMISCGININEELDKVNYVISSFDTSLNYDKLCKAVSYLLKGAKLIATNPDIFCPIDNEGKIPDCGAITNLLTEVTGVEATFIGKPSKDILLPVFTENIKEEDVVMIGDRLSTDIAIGLNNNITTVHVKSGDKTGLEQNEVIPDYSFSDVKDLYIYLREELSK